MTDFRKTVENCVYPCLWVITMQKDVSGQKYVTKWYKKIKDKNKGKYVFSLSSGLLNIGASETMRS